jgi:tetratricopeptide (TPR) repeat protein
LNKLDSALFYGQKGFEVNRAEQINWNFPLIQLATIYEKLGYLDTALIFYRNALPMAIRENIMVDVVKNYLGRAEIFKKMGQPDSTIFYAREAIAFEKKIDYKQGVLEASLLLSEAYENKHMDDSAFRYYKFAGYEG